MSNLGPDGLAALAVMVRKSTQDYQDAVVSIMSTYAAVRIGFHEDDVDSTLSDSKEYLDILLDMMTKIMSSIGVVPQSEHDAAMHNFFNKYANPN